MDILYFIEQLEMSNKHKKTFTPIVNHKNTHVLLFSLSVFLKHSKMRKSYFLSKKQRKNNIFKLSF